MSETVQPSEGDMEIARSVVREWSPCPIAVAPCRRPLGEDDQCPCAREAWDIASALAQARADERERWEYECANLNAIIEANERIETGLRKDLRAEREACAKIADEEREVAHAVKTEAGFASALTARDIAAAIRSRK